LLPWVLLAPQFDGVQAEWAHHSLVLNLLIQLVILIFRVRAAEPEIIGIEAAIFKATGFEQVGVEK
jgi:hypothetical protein